MNSKQSRSMYFTALSRFNGRKVSVALSVAFASGLIAGNACAQFAVIDPVHIAQDAANFVTTTAQYGETIRQYAKEIQQYQQVLQHYQQQLVNLTHMNFRLPTMQNSYQEISDSDAQDQVTRACPSTDASGPLGAVSGLLQIFTPSANSKILENQRRFCEQVQFRHIDKYNLTVKMMKRLQDYSSNLQNLQQQAEAGGESQGALAGSNTNIQINMTALENEMKTWNGQIQADDQMISYMQSQQSVQAREILRGSNTFIGTLVQAGTFAAAFE